MSHRSRTRRPSRAVSYTQIVVQFDAECVDCHRAVLEGDTAFYKLGDMRCGDCQAQAEEYLVMRRETRRPRNATRAEKIAEWKAVKRVESQMQEGYRLTMESEAA